MVEAESGGGRCSEYDVVEVVKEANKNGEVLMTIKDVIKKLKGRSNCRDYRDRTLYAKVERALEKKLIMFDPYRGFIAVDLKHKDLVLKGCQLILCEEVTCKVLREELGLQYERLDEVVKLVEIALQHVITYWEERIRGRVEEVKVLVERLRSAREQLEVMERGVEREIKELIFREEPVKEVINLLKQTPRMEALTENLPKFFLEISRRYAFEGSLSKSSCNSTILANPSYRVFEPLCDRMEILEEEAPLISNIVRHIAERMRAIKQLEDEVRRLEEGLRGWHSELEGLTKVFYLRSKERIFLDGWCELCSRKLIDEELKAIIRNFIEMSGVKEKLDKLWRPRVTRIRTISGWAIIE